MSGMKLGVNIDHVATIRQARGTRMPDPVAAAAIAEMAGAAGITVHLREDRRHIQDRDVRILRETVETRLNLEMSLAPDIVDVACSVRPHCACLVPEKREELTTEGGLDCISHAEEIRRVTERLQDGGTIVSLFIDPDPEQIEAAAKTGTTFIELHTGCFADAASEGAQLDELTRLVAGAAQAFDLGLRINAGHGLNYHNVGYMHEIPRVEELNIGHAIIARAVLVGLDRAVRDMVELLEI